MLSQATQTIGGRALLPHSHRSIDFIYIPISRKISSVQKPRIDV
jgi:hypothetical protein